MDLGTNFIVVYHNLCILFVTINPYSVSIQGVGP